MDHISNLVENLARVISSREEGQQQQLQYINDLFKKLDSKLVKFEKQPKEYLEALQDSNTDAYNSFSSRICDIEEKVSHIRSMIHDRLSILNRQPLTISVPPASTSDNASSIKNHEISMETLESLEALERSMNTVERALKARVPCPAKHIGYFPNLVFS